MRLNPCSELSVLCKLYRKSSPDLLAASYLLIKGLAERVVSEVPGEDPDFAHDIAVDISYRISKKSLRPPRSMGSLRWYIKRSLFSDQATKGRSKEISFDFSMFDAFFAGEDLDLDRKLDGDSSVACLIGGLRAFYSMPEIRANLPLAVTSYRDKAVVGTMEPEFRKFYLTFEYMLRKLREENEFGSFFLGASRIDDAMKSILAAVALKRLLADYADSDLVFALDFGSLIRLVQAAGGKVVQVPEMKVVNEILARGRTLPEYVFGAYSTLSEVKNQKARSPVDTVVCMGKRTLPGFTLSDFLRESLREIPLDQYLGIVTDTLISLLGEMVETLNRDGKIVGDDRYLLVVEEVSRLIYLLNKSASKTVVSSVSLMSKALAEGEIPGRAQAKR